MAEVKSQLIQMIQQRISRCKTFEELQFTINSLPPEHKEALDSPDVQKLITRKWENLSPDQEAHPLTDSVYANNVDQLEISLFFKEIVRILEDKNLVVDQNQLLIVENAIRKAELLTFGYKELTNRIILSSSIEKKWIRNKTNCEEPINQNEPQIVEIDVPGIGVFSLATYSRIKKGKLRNEDHMSISVAKDNDATPLAVIATVNDGVSVPGAGDIASAIAGKNIARIITKLIEEGVDAEFAALSAIEIFKLKIQEHFGNLSKLIDSKTKQDLQNRIDTPGGIYYNDYYGIQNVEQLLAEMSTTLQIVITVADGRKIQVHLGDPLLVDIGRINQTSQGMNTRHRDYDKSLTKCIIFKKDDARELMKLDQTCITLLKNVDRIAALSDGAARSEHVGKKTQFGLTNSQIPRKLKRAIGQTDVANIINSALEAQSRDNVAALVVDTSKY